jgi:ankyrin repeat protein
LALYKNNFDQSCLYKAAEGGHVEIAKILIAKGAETNAVDKWRWTPLAIACQNGHARMVELLLAQPGIDTSIGNIKSGHMPLIIAAARGYEDIVRQLIQKGVDVNAKTTGADTALLLAERYQQQRIATILREKGAK